MADRQAERRIDWAVPAAKRNGGMAHAVRCADSRSTAENRVGLRRRSVDPAHTSERRRWSITLCLLVGHWALVVPTRFGGFGLSPTNNVSAAVDHAPFGRHLLTPAGDPEGLLGTLSAIATALIGTLVGDWLRGDRTMSVRWLTLGGVMLAAAGYAWSWVLPLNKALWTGSYALVTSGAALLVPAAFHGLLDEEAEPRWTQPLLWLGINPLAVYFASELARQLLDRPIGSDPARSTIASWIFWSVLRPIVQHQLDDQWAALFYSLLVVTVWIVVAGQLHRHRVRLQV